MLQLFLPRSYVFDWSAVLRALGVSVVSYVA
jgi:hypothetical protein